MKMAIFAGMAGVLVGLRGCGNPPPPVAATKPATTAAATQARDAVEVIQGQIDQGIELIEAGKHREAIELLVKPDAIKKLKADKEFEEAVAKFGEKKAPAMLALLKNAKGQTPKFNEKKTSAEFPAVGGEKPLTFDKDKENWYVRN